MQPLDLNLASRPFRNNTLLWVAYGLALVLLVAWSVWNVQTYRRHTEQVRELRADVGGLDQRFADLERRNKVVERELEKYDLRSLALRSDKANDVIRWKAFSWTELFNLLESIQPHDVRMTSVHPLFHADRRRRGTGSVAQPDADASFVPVMVEGVAKNLPAFLELERELLLHPYFDRVEPEKTDTTEHGGETVFALRFLYEHEAALRDALEATEAEGGSEPPAAEPETDEDEEEPGAGEESSAADRAALGAEPGPAVGRKPRGRAMRQGG